MWRGVCTTDGNGEVCMWLCRDCGVCEEGVWDRCEGV